VSPSGDPSFSRDRADKAMALALIDVVFHAIMVGFGEVYFLADAVRLGASPLQLALVGTMPLCVGALGPMVTLRALGRFRRRKPIVLIAAGLQIATLSRHHHRRRHRVLTPVVLIAGQRLPDRRPGTPPPGALGGDLVPAGSAGATAGRNRGAHLSTCCR
jgi:hypothetical protein